MKGIPDDHVLALSVEGGGMRGIVSGAMLIALSDLGIMPLFDRVYGTSAGSINVTYYAAGCAWDALSVYYDHLTRGFVRGPLWRIDRPALDMDYLVDSIMAEKVPLDTAALSESTMDVRITLSDADTNSTEIIRPRLVADHILDYLKGSSWLPALSGWKPLPLNGHRYLDGGVLCPDPLYAAMAEGCTHVLCLNTAAENSTNGHSQKSRTALRYLLNRWNPELGDAYIASRLRWDKDKSELALARPALIRGTSVVRVAPGPAAHKVSRLTMDRGDLLDGARAGYSTIRSFFGRPMGNAVFSVIGDKQ